MADGTIDSQLFHLIDNWPGVPTPGGLIPQDGFTAAAQHNVAAARRRVGEKIQVYCDGLLTGTTAGYATLMYLKMGTQNPDVAVAAKTICVPDSATNILEVTNDPDSCISLPTGMVAIALSAMTNGYYGWFWVGGVCPEQYVAALGGNYLTEGNVAAGHITAKDMTADSIGFGANSLALSGGVETVVIPVACGYALAADTDT